MKLCLKSIDSAMKKEVSNHYLLKFKLQLHKPMDSAFLCRIIVILK